MIDVIPGTQRICRKYIPVVHFPGCSLVQMVIHVVADEQVRHLFRASGIADFPDLCQKLFVCRFLQPVVRIYDFIILSPGKLQTFVDSCSVTAVFLVDCLNDTRIFPLVCVRDLSGTVHRAVVYDQDLHVLSSLYQRIDAALHIILRIVAGNCKCDVLHDAPPPENSIYPMP